MSEYLLISDAAKEVQVESHVLRYWEEELHLPIRRNELGHRFYTKEDVELFRQIKNMKERGLQLKAIKMILRDGRLDIFGMDQSGWQQIEDAKGEKHTEADRGVIGSSKSITETDEEWREKKGGKTGYEKQEGIGKEQDDVSQEEERNRQRETGTSDRDKSINGQAVQADVRGMAIEILESRDVTEDRALCESSKEERAHRLQWILCQMMKEAIRENNDILCKEIKDSVIKELDYQFRLQEEREEEREKSCAQRNEEYYRKIDELLRARSNSGKNSLFRNKSMPVGKEERTERTVAYDKRKKDEKGKRREDLSEVVFLKKEMRAENEKEDAKDREEVKAKEDKKGKGSKIEQDVERLKRELGESRKKRKNEKLQEDNAAVETVDSVNQDVRIELKKLKELQIKNKIISLPIKEIRFRESQNLEAEWQYEPLTDGEPEELGNAGEEVQERTGKAQEEKTEERTGKAPEEKTEERNGKASEEKAEERTGKAPEKKAEERTGEPVCEQIERCNRNESAMLPEAEKYREKRKRIIWRMKNPEVKNQKSREKEEKKKRHFIF